MGLVRSAAGLVDIHYSQFYLFDSDGLGDAPDDSPEPWDLPQDEWFSATYNAAKFVSAADGHRAAVALEVWDTEPPTASGEWETLKEVIIQLSSGDISLSQATGEPTGLAIDLEASARSWHLRAHRSGSDNLRSIAGRIPEIPEGTERYLLQFWLLSSQTQS